MGVAKYVLVCSFLPPVGWSTIHCRCDRLERGRRTKHSDATSLPARRRVRIARPERVLLDAGHRSGLDRSWPATSHAGRIVFAGEGVQTGREIAAEAAGNGTGHGLGGRLEASIDAAFRIGPYFRTGIWHPSGEHTDAHLRQVPLSGSVAARRRFGLSGRSEGHEAAHIGGPRRRRRSGQRQRQLAGVESVSALVHPGPH